MCSGAYISRRTRKPLKTRWTSSTQLWIRGLATRKRKASVILIIYVNTHMQLSLVAALHLASMRSFASSAFLKWCLHVTQMSHRAVTGTGTATHIRQHRCIALARSVWNRLKGQTIAEYWGHDTTWSESIAYQTDRVRGDLAGLCCCWGFRSTTCCSNRWRKDCDRISLRMHETRRLHRCRSSSSSRLPVLMASSCVQKYCDDLV